MGGSVFMVGVKTYVVHCMHNLAEKEDEFVCDGNCGWCDEKQPKKSRGKAGRQGGIKTLT